MTTKKKETAQQKIIGTFVFRNDGDNCFTSKYFHGNQPYPFVEAAKRLSIPEGSIGEFTGEFRTTWIQEPHHVVSATLRITGLANNTYTLVWTDTNPMFEGIGMIYDGLLVGAYWVG